MYFQTVLLHIKNRTCLPLPPGWQAEQVPCWSWLIFFLSYVSALLHWWLSFWLCISIISGVSKPPEATTLQCPLNQMSLGWGRGNGYFKKFMSFIYVCIPAGTHRGRKRASDPWELKQQAAMKCHLDAGNWTWVQWRAISVLFTEPSLQPPEMGIF